ncbi:Glycine cleavage system transcriptional activator [Pigmentiphaga humi]|uniref:Glycine cleavage system transcriptional activator n=1 Tax=Pigmentiphaga humi TaxID=2478468 RepID=A0A3P4B191_9BURK|nr:LysR substrate-binding domain-containing protein [Pigmentiphaga humi]VCU68915.1 Glycine cleavage system transcriptional activator [Pigmentiphaga humi]
MRKLPPLNAVRAFEVAARHVSFTKAAAELNVTHGAVSRQVALLEEWLGVSLFHRAPSQLTLTEAGRGYLNEVSAVFDRLVTASMYVMQQAAPIVLRVNAPPTFTMRWLIARLSVFQRKRPDVEVRLTTSLTPPNFQENSYDMAIRGQYGPLDDCRSIPFMTEIIAPVCHVDLRETLRLDRPQDLEAHTLISYATEPYEWSAWLEAVGVPGLKPANTLSFEQMYFAFQAASEGLGLAMVPLFLAIDEILAGRLCVPFGPLGVQRRTYYANSAPTSKAHTLTSDFCDWLQREGRDTEQSITAWAASEGWTL